MKMISKNLPNLALLSMLIFSFSAQANQDRPQMFIQSESHESLLKTVEIFKKEVDRQDASLIGKTTNFDREVDKILHHKTTSRTDWKMVLGIIISLGLLVILTFGILNRTFIGILPGYLFYTDWRYQLQHRIYLLRKLLYQRQQ